MVNLSKSECEQKQKQNEVEQRKFVASTDKLQIL